MHNRIISRFGFVFCTTLYTVGLMRFNRNLIFFEEFCQADDAVKRFNPASYTKMNGMKTILVFLLMSTTVCMGQLHHDIYSPQGIALQGYDVVAYFTEQKAVKGSDAYTYNWKDITWKFSRLSNRQSFQQQPERYVPAFGGYCAYGMSNGYKAPTSPDAFRVVNGVLYLNYNIKVLEAWDKNRDSLIRKAEALWPTVREKKE